MKNLFLKFCDLNFLRKLNKNRLAFFYFFSYLFVMISSYRSELWTHIWIRIIIKDLWALPTTPQKRFNFLVIKTCTLDPLWINKIFRQFLGGSFLKTLILLIWTKNKTMFFKDLLPIVFWKHTFFSFGPKIKQCFSKTFCP